MSGYLYSNAATTTLASTLSASSTSATLALGTGTLFSSPGAGQFEAGILTDAETQTKHEIVTITARSGDTLTIARGAESSTAQTWAIGDYFFNGPTLGQMAAQLQSSHMSAPQVLGSTTGTTITPSYNQSISLTLTPPSNGTCWATGYVNPGGVTPALLQLTLSNSVNSNNSADSTNISQFHQITFPATSGVALTATLNVVNESSVVTIGSVTYGIGLLFFPSA